MQLTVNSTDSLASVLRAVEGLYAVRLQAADDTTAPARPARKAATPGRRGRRPARRTDTAVVRAWAQDNGHSVSDRGRIPAALVAAYQAAG